LFAQNAGSATGVPREHQIWWALILGNVSLTFLVAVAINLTRATSTFQGAKIAATFGFFTWLGIDSLQYGLTNLWKPAILIIDPVLSVIPYGITGGVIALILGNRDALKTSPDRQAV
jgi:hypothetical protein